MAKEHNSAIDISHPKSVDPSVADLAILLSNNQLSTEAIATRVLVPVVMGCQSGVGMTNNDKVRIRYVVESGSLPAILDSARYAVENNPYLFSQRNRQLNADSVRVPGLENIHPDVEEYFKDMLDRWTNDGEVLRARLYYLHKANPNKSRIQQALDVINDVCVNSNSYDELSSAQVLFGQVVDFLDKMEDERRISLLHPETDWNVITSLGQRVLRKKNRYSLSAGVPIANIIDVDPASPIRREDENIAVLDLYSMIYAAVSLTNEEEGQIEALKKRNAPVPDHLRTRLQEANSFYKAIQDEIFRMMQSCPDQIVTLMDRYEAFLPKSPVTGKAHLPDFIRDARGTSKLLNDRSL